MGEPKTLRGLISVPGFKVTSKLTGVPGDRYARVIRLKRQKKVGHVRVADIGAAVGMTVRLDVFETWVSEGGESTLSMSGGVYTAGAARRCTWKS